MKAPSRAALLGLSLLSVLVSAALYAGFFAAIGDPTAILGSAHGNWQALRPYYKPALAACSAGLAFASPEASLLTLPLFALTQLVTCLVCCSLGAPPGRSLWSNPMWPLGLLVLVVDVAPLVFGPGLLGAAGRILARVLGRKLGRPR